MILSRFATELRPSKEDSKMDKEEAREPCSSSGAANGGTAAQPSDQKGERCDSGLGAPHGEVAVVCFETFCHANNVITAPSKQLPVFFH